MNIFQKQLLLRGTPMSMLNPCAGQPLPPRKTAITDFEADVGKKLTCPDCGCPIAQHNAVNKIGEGRQIAHCGGCGACWRSEGTVFVFTLVRHLESQ